MSYGNWSGDRAEHGVEDGAERNAYRGGAGTGNPALSRLRALRLAVLGVAQEMEEREPDPAAVASWAARLREIEVSASRVDAVPDPPRPAGPVRAGLRQSWDCRPGHPAGCVHVTHPHAPIAGQSCRYCGEVDDGRTWCCDAAQEAHR